MLFQRVVQALKAVRMSCWANELGLVGMVRLRMYAPNRLCEKTHPATLPEPSLINGLLYFMGGLWRGGRGVSTGGRKDF